MSDTALFLCQAVSPIISHPMTNSLWVTQLYFFARQSHQSSHPMTNRMWVTQLYLFARQSHQSCLIPWPTACEWDSFISLPGSFINHVSSHDQQEVSDTALFLCQAVSLIMSHPMINRLSVTQLYFFARQSYQSCFIPWQIACEWHNFIS